MVGWPGCSSLSAWPPWPSWSTSMSGAAGALGHRPASSWAGPRASSRSSSPSSRWPAPLSLPTPGRSQAWPGWVGLALAVVSVAGLVGLAVVAARAGAGGGRRPSAPPAAPRSPPADPAGMEPVVAAGDRHPVPVAGYQSRPQHRLLGRRQLPPQARHPQPALGRPRGRAGPRLRPRRGLGHRGQAPAGHPADARAGPAGLGVRGDQLPAEPPGHLAGAHRRLQAGGGLGPGPHRRVRGRPGVHRRLGGLGRRPPRRPGGPDPGPARVAARVRGGRHLGRRLPPLLRGLRHDR